MSRFGLFAFFAQADNAIDDIRPPYFFYAWIHSAWWIPLALIFAAILLVALLVLLWPPRRLSAQSAYDLALEKLEQARALLRDPEHGATVRATLHERYDRLLLD